MHPQTEETTGTSSDQQEETNRLNVNVFKGDQDKPSKAEKYLIGISLIVLILNILTMSYVCKQTEASKAQADAAIIQANTSIKTVELAQQSSIASDTTSKKSLSIAERSVAVGENAARIQEKYAKVETRAYICLSDREPEGNPFNLSSPIKVSLLFINAGKTPAYNVRFKSQIKTGTGVWGNEMNAIKVPIEGGKVVGMGQMHNVEVTSTGNLTLMDSIAIFTGKYTMFFYGKILYDDKFGDTHFTNFCLAYSYWNNRYFFYKNFNDAN